MDNNNYHRMGEEQLDFLRRKTLRKLDLYVIPCLSFLWLANTIDRSNIGNARIAGLDKDLHLRGTQFNVGLAVFFISYLIVDLPSNLFLYKAKANRWLPIAACAWGFTTIGTGFIKNFSGLLAVRLILGACEGSLLPCMLLYMSTFYPRHMLQFRMASFYSAVALSGAFGGLLAAAILKMDGVRGLAGWRWIFILEGMVTVILGLWAAWILPADLKSARFLTDQERFAYVRYYTRSNPHAFPFSPETVIGDQVMEGSTPVSEKESEEQVETHEFSPARRLEEKFEWREVMRGLFDFQTWIMGLACFSNVAAVSAYSLFLPSIVSQLGYTGVQAQLHSVYPYIPATTLTAIVAFTSDRMKTRGPFVLAFTPIAVIGFIINITIRSNHIRYAGLFLAGIGAFPCSPGIVITVANNHMGYYKRAASLGLQLTLGNCGSILATFVYTTDQQPRYIRGHSIILALLVFSWFMVALNMAYCWRENKARAEGKREHNRVKYQLLVESGKTRAPIGDRDPAFRFTL